jgi:hypothetical protein
MHGRIAVSVLALTVGVGVAAVIGTAQASTQPFPATCSEPGVHCSSKIFYIFPVGPNYTDSTYVADVEYASMADRAKVHLWGWIYQNAAQQEWYEAKIDNHPGFAFINGKSGKCMDKSMDHGDAVGAQIYQFSCHFGRNQLWNTRNQSNQATTEVYSIEAPGQCMDLKDFQYGYGAAIQSWYCSGGWNQGWYLTDQE